MHRTTPARSGCVHPAVGGSAEAIPGPTSNAPSIDAAPAAAIAPRGRTPGRTLFFPVMAHIHSLSTSLNSARASTPGDDNRAELYFNSPRNGTVSSSLSCQANSTWRRPFSVALVLLCGSVFDR